MLPRQGWGVSSILCSLAVDSSIYSIRITMVSCASKPPNARHTYFQQSRSLLKPSEPRRTLKTLASVPVSLSLFARSRWTPASGSASAGGAKRLQLRLLLPLLLSLPQLLPLLIATMHVRSFSSLNSVSQCSVACRIVFYYYGTFIATINVRLLSYL